MMHVFQIRFRVPHIRVTGEGAMVPTVPGAAITYSMRAAANMHEELTYRLSGLFPFLLPNTASWGPGASEKH